MSNPLTSRLIQNFFLTVFFTLQLSAQQTADLVRGATLAQVKSAVSLRNAGDYQKSEVLFRQLLAEAPTGSSLHAALQNNLGSILQEQGRNAEAREFFADVTRSANPWQLRLDAFIGLANVDEHLGLRETETDEWNAALDIARRQNDTVSEAAILRGLGSSWLRAGSAVRAEPLLRHSLRLAETNPGKDPLNLAGSLAAMGEYYTIENKLALAEDACSRALKIDQGQFGEDHPQVAVLMDLLANVYSQRGELDLAQDYAERAERVMRVKFGDSSPSDATALANLALVEQRARKFDDAAKHYEASLRILRQPDESSSNLRIILERYELVLKSLHRNREAKALAVEAKSFRAQ